MVGFSALVPCFSIGLARVTVSIGAALSLKHATKRWSGFIAFAQRAPYFPRAPIAIVDIYTLAFMAGRE